MKYPFLFCACAALLGSPLSAEEDMEIATAEQEAIPFEMEYDDDDDDLMLEDFAAIEDDLFDDISFDDDADDDDIDALTASDLLQEEDSIPGETSIS